MSYETRTEINGTKDWDEQKKNIMRELARLEQMNWAADDKVAQTIFPYVLVEAINLLKNSTLVDNPVDYADSGENATKMVKELIG